MIIIINQMEGSQQAIQATVMEILARTGSRGAITQVRVTFQTPTGPRSLIRNVMGPVRKGDLLCM